MKLLSTLVFFVLLASGGMPPVLAVHSDYQQCGWNVQIPLEIISKGWVSKAHLLCANEVWEVECHNSDATIFYKAIPGRQIGFYCHYSTYSSPAYSATFVGDSTTPPMGGGAPRSPGFEFILAITGLLAVAYLANRRKR